MICFLQNSHDSHAKMKTVKDLHLDTHVIFFKKSNIDALAFYKALNVTGYKTMSN